MALTIFWIAAAVAVLAIGGGVAYAMVQLAQVLKHVRTTMMPQLELTLTEVQRNLTHIDALTQEVDTTVESANQLVSSANKTVQTVNDGIDRFNKQVAAPFLIRMASAAYGVKTGWQAFRTREERPLQVIRAPEPSLNEPIEHTPAQPLYPL